MAVNWSQFPRVAAQIAAGALRSIAAAIGRGVSGLPLFNWIRKRFGPLSSTEGSVLYQTAVSYVAAGAAANQLGSTEIVNPATVPQVDPAFSLASPQSVVLFDLRVGYTDPATGQQRWLTTYVDSDTWLNKQEVLGEATNPIDQQHLETLFGGGGPDAISPFINALNIVGIVRR